MSVPIPYAFFQSDDGTGFVLQALGSQGDGALVFTQLQDAPSSYTGHGSKFLKVKSTADGVEFVAATTSAFTQLSDAPVSYTGHGSKFLKVKSSADGVEFVAATIPAFTQLSDAPASYAGQGGKTVTVNTGATALEFTTPTITVQVLADVTLGSDVPAYTFSSIPQTFNHLKLVSLSKCSATSANNIIGFFNDDLDLANYVQHQTLSLDDTVTAADTLEAQAMRLAIANGETDSDAFDFGISETMIYFYRSTSTNRYRKVRCQSSYYTGTKYADVVSVATWKSGAAITSILLDSMPGVAINSGSRFILYGLL